MGTLFCTSAGLSAAVVRTEFENALPSAPNKRVAFVVTAAEEKAHNKYALMGKASLESLGCAVDLVDLETDPDFDFSPYGIIYVTGGNTFFLLEHARAAHFGETVQALLDRNGIYFGVSAGSLIMAPDISIVDFTGGDPNDIGMTDFTAFGFTDWYFDVHYTPADESTIADFEQKSGHKVSRLTDAQAIVIENGRERLI